MCIIAKNKNVYRNSVNYKIKMCAYIYIYMLYILYIIKITSCNSMCIHLMNRI